MASENDASVGDGPVIVLPPIPSSCFSPIATITDFSSRTSVVLPTNAECIPWSGPPGYSLSSAYSSRGICPSGWMHDAAWNVEDALSRAVCCPSGFTPARDDIYTTFTSSGTTTLEVGSSVFSTEFTSVLRTSWPSSTCYSTLSAPTVLMLAVSSGEPPQSASITSQMLVSADYVKIKSPSAGPSPAPSSADSASPSSSRSASPASRASTSATSRGSTFPDSNDPAAGAAGTSSNTVPTDVRAQSSGLPQAATIGLAVGITAVVMALLFGLYIVFSRRRRKQKRLEQQAAMPGVAPYPELETHPAQHNPYVMLDSTHKFELAADHSWKVAEADPGRPYAGAQPVTTFRN